MKEAKEAVLQPPSWFGTLLNFPYPKAVTFLYSSDVT